MPTSSCSYTSNSMNKIVLPVPIEVRGGDCPGWYYESTGVMPYTPGGGFDFGGSVHWQEDIPARYMCMYVQCTRLPHPVWY